MEDLQIQKEYKEDTLHQAINIADHYLASLSARGNPAPCMISLAATSLIIAAKIEQHK